MEQGLSLRELGRRIGLSASLLSQIETGKTEPSVSTLYALVTQLNLSLDALLERPADVEVDAAEPVDQSAGRPSGSGRNSNPVVTHAERRVLHMESGVSWERLTRGPSDVDMLLVTYEPGGTSSTTGKHMTHGGREFAYIIEGSLTLELAFETHILRPGDSLEFNSSIPHLFHNDGDVRVRGVWFVLADAHHHGVAGTAEAENRSARDVPPQSAVDVLQDFHRR
jgi:transcriptional regulator with XRE-family HTH domain/uncharacterized cupin superfamily protein